MQILWVFETDVVVVQKGLFGIQNVENRFFMIYFHELRYGNRGVTRGYRRLQAVTGGYQGIQGLTGGDKELQGVTRGYRGLQEVTGGYKA